MRRRKGKHAYAIVEPITSANGHVTDYPLSKGRIVLDDPFVPHQKKGKQKTTEKTWKLPVLAEDTKKCEKPDFGLVIRAIRLDHRRLVKREEPIRDSHT